MGGSRREGGGVEKWTRSPRRRRPLPSTLESGASPGESGAGGVMEPKRAAAEADRLSSLPVALQDEILVRLDLRDAVRTSALSRAWPDLWKSLSVISLSFPLGTHPSVVDSVVLRYTGPRVSLFDINVDEACAGRIDDWLVALSRCRVDSIGMRGQLRSDYFNLNSSIFSFGDLVSLRLVCCKIPPLPVGFAGFPVLQELDLKGVAFTANGGNQLEAIIRGSPLLHALNMFHVSIPKDCPNSVIEAPNLHSITIYAVYDYGWRVGELPCLEYANIDVWFFYPQHQHNFGDFLAPFAHVQKLRLLLPADGIRMPYTLPFTFYNLKDLMLSMDFTEWRPILFMFTLLRTCHNIEKLEIQSRDGFDQDFEADWEFLSALWTGGMCASLQTVQMSRVIWHPNEILFMKLVLSKARLLRTLYVDTHPDDFDDPIIDLLKCKRASAQACVQFEGIDLIFPSNESSSESRSSNLSGLEQQY